MQVRKRFLKACAPSRIGCGAALLYAGLAVGQSLTVSDGATVYIDNGGQVDLGTTTTLVETGGGRVTGGTGTITGTRDLNAPSNHNVAGLGAVITSSANLGTTVVTRGFIPQTVGGDTSVARYFDIQPANNTGLNATLVFTYFDAELGAVNESALTLFRSTDGGTSWANQGGIVDTGANSVTLAAVDGFSRWTAGQPMLLPPPETTPPGMVSLVLTGAGAGSVTSAPPGINCPGDCSEAFVQGTTVVLTATADAGDRFAGWSGCPSADGNQCTFTVNDSSFNLSAAFKAGAIVAPVPIPGLSWWALSLLAALIALVVACRARIQSGP